MSNRTLPQTFVGGEIGPRMFGRPDDPKYQHGAETMLNYYPEASGTAPRLPGTEFVREARNPDRKARMVAFRASGGQDIQVELGSRQEYDPSIVPGYARFHRNGLPVLHSTAWDATTAYVVGDLVQFGGQLYLCRLAHTNQTPTNVTYWKTLEYVPALPFRAAVAAAPPLSGIVTGTPGEIYFGAGNNHNLETGDPIEFTGDAGTTAPTGLSYGVLYYAIFIDAERIRVSATFGGAAIGITGLGVGTFHRMHRQYAVGMLTSRSAAFFYCRQTRPIDGAGQGILPTSGNETYWYQEPNGHEFEIPTTLLVTDEQLMKVSTGLDSAKMSLATETGGPFELLSLSAAGLFDTYQTWQWQTSSFAATPEAPNIGFGSAATKRGNTLTIETVDGVGGGGVNTALSVTKLRHLLQEGLDFIYVEGSAYATINNRFFAIEDGATDKQLVLIHPDTGSYVTLVGAPAGGGTIRVSSLYSDTSHTYKVTAIDERGRESQPSTGIVLTNNLTAIGAYNTVEWSGVSGAVRYRVYRTLTGSNLYGLMREANALSFIDDGTIAPTFDVTPPLLDPTPPASSADTIPEAVTHFQDRRCFAAGQDVWMSRTGTDSDFSYTIPTQATDRIHERLRSPANCSILHLVPMRYLVALSDTTEFHIVPIDGGAITADSFAVRAQTYVGSIAVQPVIINDVLLFAARGGHVYRMGFTDEGGGYVPVDLCERATHMFEGLLPTQMARQTSPVPIAWVTQDDGNLLGMTFVPSQQVFAWFRATTDGEVESVSVGTEGKEDRSYMIVKRGAKRFVERRASMLPQAWNDSWFVDCGVRVETSASVTTVTGIPHPDGTTVQVFANGLVQADRVVQSGAITLETPLPAGDNTVLVGLASVNHLRTLPATFNIEGYAIGSVKNVSRVFVRVEDSGSFQLGADQSDLIDADTGAGEGVPFSGTVDARAPATWTNDGQVSIVQPLPLPLTVVGVTVEMEVTQL